jgi:hypothetical protein
VTLYFLRIVLLSSYFEIVFYQARAVVLSCPVMTLHFLRIVFLSYFEVVFYQARAVVLFCHDFVFPQNRVSVLF